MIRMQPLHVPAQSFDPTVERRCVYTTAVEISPQVGKLISRYDKLHESIFVPSVMVECNVLLFFGL